MLKISKIPAIIFLTTIIIGIILLITGINMRIYVFQVIEQNKNDPDWDRFGLSWTEFYSWVWIGIGTLLIILTVILAFSYYYQFPSKVVEKNYYKNEKWLNHQYNELRRSLQDIAIDQGVSMITIKKWVDKLDKH
ncbi:MAG: hypothetical protein ACFFA3_08155 [Promethearchaeota archaeon]